MKLNFDELDIMSLDLQSLTPEQRSTLVQWPFAAPMRNVPGR